MSNQKKIITAIVLSVIQFIIGILSLTGAKPFIPVQLYLRPLITIPVSGIIIASIMAVGARLVSHKFLSRDFLNNYIFQAKVSIGLGIILSVIGWILGLIWYR